MDKRRLKFFCFIAMTGECWKCGETVELASGARLSSRETCGRCGADLHCCKNCEFYNPSKNNQCAESAAEWTPNKHAANYCDYFRLSQNRSALVNKSQSSRATDAKKEFNALFGG